MATLTTAAEHAIDVDLGAKVTALNVCSSSSSILNSIGATTIDILTKIRRGRIEIKLRRPQLTFARQSKKAAAAFSCIACSEREKERREN
jgi:hypothetical protein